MKTKIIKTVVLLTVCFAMYSISETVINEPFGTNFVPKKTTSGDILTVCAFATDSSNFYLYDMADRSIGQFDSSGTFIKKIPLQSIGRDTYIGDDFVVRGSEAIFLNTVDSRLEFFYLSNGFLKKSLLYPRHIPVITGQRRYRIISRIFIDNGKIFIGNNHAVFQIDEKAVLQKVAASQVRNFAAGSMLLLFRTPNHVMSKMGVIKWNQQSASLEQSGYPMLGKQVGIIANTLYSCNVNKSGITITSIELTK